jgi:hypothetical protein
MKMILDHFLENSLRQANQLGSFNLTVLHPLDHLHMMNGSSSFQSYPFRFVQRIHLSRLYVDHLVL